jgi:hypothetical protein
MDQTTEKIYEQVNENWRFLARWRQLAFAGHLTAMYGGLSLISLAKEHAYPRWAIGSCFLMLAGVSYIFWIFDRRTYRLTMHACEAGVGLEMESQKMGFFRVNAKLDAEQKVHSLRPDGHSMAANLLFRGSSLLLAISGLLMLIPRACLGL